jgi:sulfite exporter TauE/SafE
MWTTAVIMGLAGSLHCLGMCSPLAMAATGMRGPYFLNRLVYNGGRILSYGILGALVGTVGTLFVLPNIQAIVSISLGVTLIAIGMTGVHIQVPFVSGFLQRVTIWIKKVFSNLLKKKSILSTTLLGMVNGLLPCGLTYLALAYCVTTDSAIDAFTFMLIFGAGTLPVMLGFTSVLQGLINRFRFNLRSFTSITMVVLGLLLITRSAIGHFHPSTESKDPIVVCE